MQLTQATTTCSGWGDRRLSAYAERIRGTVQHGGELPQVPRGSPVARGFCVPTVWSDGCVAHQSRTVALSELQPTNVGNCGHDFSSEPQTAASVVSCDVAHNQPKVWHERSWASACTGARQLSHRMGMVAPTETGHGSARARASLWPGSGR